MADVRVEGVEEFQRGLQEFEVNRTREIYAAVNTLIEDAADVVRARTPVRTGQTRASIATRVSVLGNRYRAVVYPAGDTADYIAGVERRHGMFRAGQLFINRNVRQRLEQAVVRALQQSFGE